MQIRFIVGALGFALVLIGAAAYWLEAESTGDGLTIESDQTAAEPVETAPLVPLPSDEEVSVSDEDVDSLEASVYADEQLLPAEEQAEPQLPALHESDIYVRNLLQPWAWPGDWLAREGLMQRAATLLSNLSQGSLPRRQIAFLAPAQKFGVRRVSDHSYELVTAGYARFDGFVAAVTRLPHEEAAHAAVVVEALLKEGLAQLGEHRAVEKLLADVVSQIDATPEITDPILLRRENVLYTFADPQLEALPELNKQLLRMGPDNVRQIKSYARQFLRSYRVRKAQS